MSDELRRLIRDVPDFPSPGIMFRDITPLLEDAHGFRQTIDAFAARYRDKGIVKVVGIESRGFLLASAVAYAIGAGLVLLRKPGKLPRATVARPYALEYGESTLHMHADAVRGGERVVLVDDVIATGGTIGAGAHLLAHAGAVLHEAAVVIELSALRGRNALSGLPFFSLLAY